MKKLILPALAVAWAGVPLTGEVVVFDEGFGVPTAGTYCDPAFPAGWVRHDEDAANPDANVAFVTSAWVTLEDDLEPGNCVATSTSWYDPEAQSDDWMVTPLIHVPDDARLSWRVRSHDGTTYPEAYEVRYSVAGTAPADFLANPALFTNPFEDTDLWRSRSVDLASKGLSGRAVHLAFRNVSDMKWLLYVDDVRVTVDERVFAEEFGGVDGLGLCDPVFPAGWVTHDVDGRNPSLDTDWVTDAWVAADTDDPAECAAFSTSEYQPAGAADDWMVTPAIDLPFAAELRWRGRSVAGGFEGDYEVRASTGGSEPADFTLLLDTVTAESADWTGRVVDLDAAGLGGSTVRLAFRNVSDDKYLLAIDTVEVAESLIFRDGFDHGFLGAWSAVSGAGP